MESLVSDCIDVIFSFCGHAQRSMFSATSKTFLVYRPKLGISLKPLLLEVLLEASDSLYEYHNTEELSPVWDNLFELIFTYAEIGRKTSLRELQWIKSIIKRLDDRDWATILDFSLDHHSLTDLESLITPQIRKIMIQCGTKLSESLSEGQQAQWSAKHGILWPEFDQIKNSMYLSACGYLSFTYGSGDFYTCIYPLFAKSIGDLQVRSLDLQRAIELGRVNIAERLLEDGAIIGGDRIFWSHNNLSLKMVSLISNTMLILPLDVKDFWSRDEKEAAEKVHQGNMVSYDTCVALYGKTICEAYLKCAKYWDITRIVQCILDMSLWSLKAPISVVNKFLNHAFSLVPSGTLQLIRKKLVTEAVKFQDSTYTTPEGLLNLIYITNGIAGTELIGCLKGIIFPDCKDVNAELREALITSGFW